MHMGFKSKMTDNVIIVSIEGQIDAVTGPELTEFLQAQMKDQINLVADFSKVDFISSAGLRVLLGTVKDARRQGGDLRLASVHEDVNKVLSVTGFTRIMKIFSDVEEAVESYSS